MKKTEKDKGILQTDLPAVFMKLGQVQGYFDKDGKTLKPLEISREDDSSDDQENLSKKEQIAALKDQLNLLPLGQNTQDKIAGILGRLSGAKPKLGFLSDLFNGLKSKILELLSKPKGLLSKLGKLKDLHDTLKDFKPKTPNSGLLSKIKNLLGCLSKGKNVRTMRNWRRK